jgi:hypothetical protein
MKQIQIYLMEGEICAFRKILLSFFFFMVFLSGMGTMYGQSYNNFGDGSYGSLTISASDTVYTDSTRAQVISILNSAPVYWTNLHHVHGHFHVGDWVIVINFNSSRCTKRNYTFGNVRTVANDSTIEVNFDLDTIMDVIYGATLSNAEIIKLPRWHNVTLDGGIITCHPWDGFSGGVLCFEVDGVFNTTSNPNGMITADGKGFQGGAGGAGGAGGVVVGTGGLAGSFTGANGVNGGGTVIPGENPSGYTIVSSCTNNKGGDGGKASYPKEGAGGGAVIAATGFCAADINHHKIEMGNSGSSGTGGHGASSGGNGGGGGASQYYLGYGAGSADPTSGTTGTNGGNGGAGGSGGNGGGFIYIKANTLNLDNARVEVTANATDASNGTNGGNGGIGGDGGKGADGYCNGATYGAGSGGSGGPGGDGADGGDGGSGGSAGFIWIAYHASAVYSSVTFQANGGNGGLAGNGGTGGDYGITGAPGRPVDVTTCIGCTGSYYDTLHVTITKTCDCKDAFEVLDSCNAGPTNESYGFLYKNTANGDSCIYDTATHTLTCYHLKISGSTSTHPGVADTFRYTCNMHKDCEYFFEHTPMAVSPNNNYWNTFGANFGTTGNAWNYDFSNGNLYDNSSVYCSSGCTSADTGTQRSDGGTPPKGKDGSPGSPGIAGLSHTFQVIQQDLTTTNANPTEPVETGLDQRITTDSLCHILKVMPNPAFDKLTVCYTTCTAGKSMLQLRNLQGKLLMNREVDSRRGINYYTIEVKNYSPGYYILELENGNTTDKVKFVKQ